MPTPDLAFVVPSSRNAAHVPAVAMTDQPATTWGAGEYALIAERLEPAAQAVVDLAGVTADDRVLDVATGTGNATLLAASRERRWSASTSSRGCWTSPRPAPAARTSRSSGCKRTSNRRRSSPRRLGGRVGVRGDVRARSRRRRGRTRSLLRARGSARARRVVARKLHAGHGSRARSIPAAAACGGAPPSRWGDAAVVTELLGGTGSARARRPPSRSRCPFPIKPRRSTS